MKHYLGAIALLTLLTGCITLPTGGGDESSVGADDAVNIPGPPEGALKYSIMVTEFKNEAGWHGRWDIGNGFKTIMTDVLNQSGWFITLGDDQMRNAAMREQDLASSGRTAGGKKAPVTGQMTPAQLLVRGSITHVQETGSSSGGLSFKGISIGGGGGEAEINMTIYIVDSTTGQVKASKKITANSKRRGLKLGYHGSGLGGLRGNVGKEKRDNVGKAAENAVAEAVKFLVGQLEGIPWEGTVMTSTKGSIMINRGTREGVSVGKTFRVGTATIIRDPDTGEALDVDVKKVGDIKITRVKEKLSYATATSGAKSIKKGMSVLE